MTKKSTNTVWHHATITRADREALHKHKSVILWFTWLSGSGKSTLAHAVEEYLHKTGEPLAKLSTGKRNKLIKAPDKPVF